MTMTRSGTSRGHRKLFAFVAAGLVMIALLLSALPGCGGSDEDPTTSRDANGAAIVSADSLRDVASDSGTPIYWAGELEATKLELSQPGDDRTYVRYLTGDAEAGDERAGFLTIGTYVQANAASSLRRQARRSGGTLSRAPGNAIVYYDRANPRSVYLAYPGAPVEVEVYDPDFRRALRLVSSGRVVAVD
jgi:hypothetical protein